MRHVALKLSSALALFCAAASAHAGVSLAPLTTFGTNGWLAPGVNGYVYLSTSSLESNIGYGNGHLYLLSHGNFSGNDANIRILNPLTGADIGTLSSTGINQSTSGFSVSSIAVGSDGAIYVSNMSTATSSSTNRKFNIYKWTSEAANPTTIYSNTGGISTERIGDDVSLIGSGASTQLVFGYNSGSGTTPDNGFSVITPLTSPVTATPQNFASTTTPNPGDFQSSISYIDATHVLGTNAASSSASTYDYASYSGGTATLLNTVNIPDPAGPGYDSVLSYTVINGLPIMAVVNTSDAHVSLYDMTDPTNPAYLASANNTVSPATNNHNLGSITWGASTTNGDGSVSETLYAMSVNQGIEAFTVTVPASVPEPATLALTFATAFALTLRRRRRA